MTRFGVVSVHGFGAMATWPLREKEETGYHEECIYTAVCTAIALQSIRLFQSLLQKHCILFSPTHPCLYIYIFSLQVYIE